MSDTPEKKLVPLGEMKGELRNDLEHCCHRCRLILQHGTACPVCGDDISNNRRTPEEPKQGWRVVVDVKDPIIATLKPINVCSWCGGRGIATWKVLWHERFSGLLRCERCRKKERGLAARGKHRKMQQIVSYEPIADGEFDIV